MASGGQAVKRAMNLEEGSVYVKSQAGPALMIS